MTALRVALFVEGSVVRPVRGAAPLEEIWRECLGQALSLRKLDLIVPINKKHLVAMDPTQPRMSGGGEALDQLMVRVMKREPFDAAVVAWDLVPAWNPQETFCRWDETVNLYRFLAGSSSLPPVWKDQAARRYANYRERSIPGERGGPPRLEEGMVLPVCMEPMFEALLIQDESAVRRALGIRKIPQGWPRRGWVDSKERHPDTQVLGPAIRSLFRIRPKPAVLRKIHGDMMTHKNEWGELLLREMLSDERAQATILAHPIAVRLKELLSQGA